MKIVIDIPEEEYNECRNSFNMVFQDGYLNYNLNTALVLYVANGTPLPKGHGRLIDEQVIIGMADKDSNWVYDLTDMPEYIAGLPAIIPAESEDEK